MPPYAKRWARCIFNRRKEKQTILEYTELENFTTHKALDFMFDTLKEVCKKGKKQ